jgi:hypothetical protein
MQEWAVAHPAISTTTRRQHERTEREQREQTPNIHIRFSFLLS